MAYPPLASGDGVSFKYYLGLCFNGVTIHWNPHLALFMAPPASSALTHPWGISDVRIDNPLGANQLPITPWSSLKFHPIGLIHLRRHQGVFPYIPLFYKTKQASFDAADLAWFAGGLHRDGQHYRADADSFHPEYMELYNACGAEKGTRHLQKELLEKILGLIFDLVRGVPAPQSLLY